MNASEVKETDASKPDNAHRTKPIFFLGVAASLLIGWVALPFAIYKSEDQPVQFSHRIHTGDNVGLTCGDCHTYDHDGRFNGIPSKETCASCHSQTIGTSTEEERLVENYIKTDKPIRWLVYSRQPENVYFPHAAHIKIAKLDCQACHFGHQYTDNLRPARYSRISGYSIDIFGKTIFNAPATTSAGMRMDDCAGCHARNGLNDSCIDCHK